MRCIRYELILDRQNVSQGGIGNRLLVLLLDVESILLASLHVLINHSLINPEAEVAKLYTCPKFPVEGNRLVSQFTVITH